MADVREALVKLLDSLGESSQFAACGSLAPVLPGLQVEGVGTVGTPISPADAKRLIAAAAQAPYGRGEERRQHLHSQIEHHHLDCTHETERKGSPQTLVCTKTQASFERKLQQYHADCQMLSELKSLADAKPSSAAKGKRPRRAVKK